jgi:hypothetical protein
MQELKDGFNNMRTATKGIHGRDCNCSCDVYSSAILGQCTTNLCQFSRTTYMWTSIFCLVIDSKIHNSTCLEGRCSECGIDALVICPLQEDATCEKLMKWKCYETIVHGKT